MYVVHSCLVLRLHVRVSQSWLREHITVGEDCLFNHRQTRQEEVSAVLLDFQDISSFATLEADSLPRHADDLWELLEAPTADHNYLILQIVVDLIVKCRVCFLLLGLNFFFGKFFKLVSLPHFSVSIGIWSFVLFFLFGLCFHLFER